MKKRMMKSMALLLAFAMVMSVIPTTFSKAADVASQQDVEQETKPEDISTEEENLTDQEQFVSDQSTEDEPVIKTSSDLKLQYFYVESPYLESGTQQNILVSWGDGTENITDMNVVLQKSDGTEILIPCSERDGQAFLFTRYFNAEEKGVYFARALTYMLDNERYDITLSNYDITPEFGVDEAYEGYEPYTAGIEEIQQDNLDVSIVSIQEDGTTTNQESIEDALAATDESVASTSTYSMSARSTNSNKVVVLDPGHGGSDPGASGNGLNEKDLTLKIAQYCKQELEKYSGVTVQMTRTSDVYVGLEERVNKAKAWGADVFVSIHINSAESSSAHGAEVYYPNSNYDATTGAEGKKLAQQIQNELVSLGLYNRGIKTKTSSSSSSVYPDQSLADYYSVIRNSKLAGFPGIIVEHAFINNTSDVDKVLKTEAGLQSLGVADAKGIAAYLGLSAGGWVKIDGKWYWKEGNSYKKNSWLFTGGCWYWLTADGSMATGWQTIATTKYYFNASGVMLTGVQTIGANKYYFGGTGGLLTGWISDGTYSYYSDANGALQTGFQMIGGKPFQFDSNCRLMMGWVQNPNTNKWYYVIGKNAYATGWKYIGSDYYYFASDGCMQTGWLNISKYSYYLNGSGQMVTGLQNIGGKNYYFASGGQMLKSCWVTAGNNKYYMTADGTAMTSGWHVIDNVKYLFNDNGAVVTSGWAKVNGTYYFIQSSTCVTGWKYIGSDYYYFASDGSMQTGWLNISKYSYYLNGSGQMVTGLQNISGKKYYFASGGQMLKSCWVTSGNNKYYMTADGTAMTSGWHVIDNVKYLFNDNGAVVTSGWAKVNGTYYYIQSSTCATGWKYIGSDYYYFASDGSMQTGWLNISKYSYYLNGSGQMVTGLQNISGKNYYFASGGPMLKSCWVTSGNNKYYMTADGTAMTSGWHVIDNVKYLFNDNGAVVTSGWAKINGTYYYIQTNGSVYTGWLKEGSVWYYLNTKANGNLEVGYMQTGWLKLGNYYYYMNSSGVMQTGWTKVNGTWYYLNAGGVMLTGWLQLGSNWYYLDESGAMACNGWKKVGDTYYYFESSGEWNSKMPQSSAPKDGYTNITGGNSFSIINKMVQYYQSSGAIYPSYYAEHDAEAKTLYDFCRIYYEEATAENIRCDLAFCQGMKETGWLRYGGDVKISQYNFAGIGATGDGAEGNAFESVRIGIRAQIQHLQAYATPKSVLLKHLVVDPRYYLVSRGCAPYIENLGGKWAAGANYGYEIADMAVTLNKY